MPLTEETFITAIDTIKQAYINWELPEDSVDTWYKTLSLSITDELLLRTTIDWVSSKTNSPNSPADIIKHGKDMYISSHDSADASAEILLESARSAYYVTDDFLSFDEMYRNSFASASGIPSQEVYIKENIRNRSSNPKVLILVYDEVKGDLKSCFTGDAEHGIDFLRGQIKKKWNDKMTDAAKDFLRTGGSSGYLEA